MGFAYTVRSPILTLGGGAERSGGYDRDGPVRRSQAMNFFSVVLLAERHRAQDRRQNHSRPVNPSHGLVEADRTASLGDGTLRRADGVTGGDAIQVAGQSAEGDVQIAGGGAFAASARIERGHHRSNHGDGGDQAHALMDFQHVGALIQQSLLRGVGLRFAFRKAEVRERRRRLVAGRSVGQILRRRGRRCGRLLPGRGRQLQGQRLRSTGDQRHFRGLATDSVGRSGDFVIACSEIPDAVKTSEIGLCVGQLTSG